jgi:hypothetical protein
MPVSKNLTIKKYTESWVPVAHACNPRYSGGRDQEDSSSKPGRPYLKNTHPKKGLEEWL